LAEHGQDVWLAVTPNEEFPWATALIVLIALTVLIGGGLTVNLSDSYTMDDYFTDLGRLSIGIGLLGIGRGIRSGLIKRRE
jgi:hypothetical protein